MTWFLLPPQRITCAECGKKIWKCICDCNKETGELTIHYWEKTFLLLHFYQKHKCKKPEKEEVKKE